MRSSSGPGIVSAWFAVAMLAIAGSMLLPRRNEGDPAVRLNRALVLKLAPVGLATGLAALAAPRVLAQAGATPAGCWSG